MKSENGISACHCFQRSEAKALRTEEKQLWTNVLYTQAARSPACCYWAAQEEKLFSFFKPLSVNMVNPLYFRMQPFRVMKVNSSLLSASVWEGVCRIHIGHVTTWGGGLSEDNQVCLKLQSSDPGDYGNGQQENPEGHNCLLDGMST